MWYTDNNEGRESATFFVLAVLAKIKTKMKNYCPKTLFAIFVAFIVLAAFFIFSDQSLAAEIIDSDNDGLSDQDEINLFKTDPNNPDTDGDGYNDYTEIYNGYSPRQAEPVKLSSLDSDNDGAPDSWEIRLGLDLLNPDTDSDGYNDGLEIASDYDPKVAEAKKLAKEIKVDLKTQTLAYYFNNIELENFLISSGVKAMPTPTGEFSVLDKVPSKNYGGTGFNFTYPNTKWNLHFTTGTWRYYIHGAYWHNKFGRPMSHGCINVPYPQMERLYGFASVGTKVEIS